MAFTSAYEVFSAKNVRTAWRDVMKLKQLAGDATIKRNDVRCIHVLSKKEKEWIKVSGALQ